MSGLKMRHINHFDPIATMGRPNCAMTRTLVCRCFIATPIWGSFRGRLGSRSRARESFGYAGFRFQGFVVVGMSLRPSGSGHISDCSPACYYTHTL